MKNKFILIISLLLFNIIFSSNLNSSEIFNFNVTELEVTQNGNLYKGTNGGKASTQDGILIIAEDFEFNKLNANLIAKNNVQFIDSKKDVLINADEIIYFKNQEKIINFLINSFFGPY